MFTSVVFIDIDGVLVLEKWGTPNWNIQCVQLFIHFLTKCPDVKLVISSTWRKSPKLIYEFMTLLVRNGIDIDRVIGMTPDIDLFKRDSEILEYLVTNSIEDYVVVDDAPEFFVDDKLNSNNMYYVNRNLGFSGSCCDYLIKRFSKE